MVGCCLYLIKSGKHGVELNKDCNEIAERTCLNFITNYQK